jgi:cysteine synthase
MHVPVATESVLGSIGNTPLVELRKVVPAGCGRVFAKLEWANPTGNMKDRMAVAAIGSAEAVFSDAFSEEKRRTMQAFGARITDVPSDNQQITEALIEPAESAVLSGGPSGSHKIEGIGIGFIPPLWRPDQVNEIEPVATPEAKEMTRRLAREEGIFGGTSSGANVVAAIRVARSLGPGAKVVTIICDSGLRYVSTDVYREPA